MRLIITVERGRLLELLKRQPNLATHRRVKAAMRESAQVVKERFQQYPPKPPGSRYRRTGDLRRSIARKVEDGGLVHSVVSKIEYAPFVIGHKQTVQHSTTGWATPETVWKEKRPVIIEIMGRAIVDIFKVG